MATKERIQTVIKQCFEKQNFKYEIDTRNNRWSLVSGFQGIENADVTVGFVISVTNDDIIFLAIGSEKIAEDKLDKASEFLMRVNQCIKNGHFLLDYDNREFSFKLWCPAKGRLAENDVNHFLNVTVGSVELIASWVKQISEEDITPEQAANDYLDEVTSGA